MERTAHGIVVLLVAVPISCRERERERGGQRQRQTESEGQTNRDGGARKQEKSRDGVVKWKEKTSEAQSTEDSAIEENPASQSKSNNPSYSQAVHVYQPLGF